MKVQNCCKAANIYASLYPLRMTHRGFTYWYVLDATRPSTSRKNKRISQNNQSTCHPERKNRSAILQSKFCGLSVSEQAEPRSECDEGISKRVWVACQRKCYILSKSHQDL